MILEHLNYIAVAVCAVVYFAIGGLWFSPVLFSKPWMEGHKRTMPTEPAAVAEMKKKIPMIMGATFIIGGILTIAIACILGIVDGRGWMVGAKVGLLAGALASGPIVMSHMYTGKSTKTIIIDIGYPIVGMIIVGIILAVWK